VDKVYAHMGIIYKICNLYAAREEQDDLKQEIIYQLWKSYPGFRGDSSFESWMYRVALNTAMLGLRAQKLKYRSLSNLELKISDNPIERQEDEVRLEQLYKQISKLNDLDKSIIFLYLEKCSYQQIADITGISIKNVSVHLVRIREKLRKKLYIQNRSHEKG
jgi:RNA polymerase sigma factor (sigma-70 family)